MDQEYNNKIRIDSLEKDMKAVEALVFRFDAAIEKLGDVASSVDKMVAVQEQRLIHQEARTAEYIGEILSLRNEINGLEARVASLEGWKWFIAGGGALLGLLLGKIEFLTELFK